MRSFASSRSSVSKAEVCNLALITFIPLRRGGTRLGTNAEQMTDREHEFGAIEGIEVKLADAALAQIVDLLGGDRRGFEWLYLRKYR